MEKLGFSYRFKLLLGLEYQLIKANPASVLSTFLFCGLIMLVFQFNLPTSIKKDYQLMHALIWITTLFGGILRINRSFESEERGGVFDALKQISGISSSLFLSKILVNFVFLILLNLFSLICYFLFFNLSFDYNSIIYHIPIWILGDIGLVMMGTLFSIMIVGHEKRDLILPIILYPLLIPLVIGVLVAINYNIYGIPFGINTDWVKIILSFDIIISVISFLMFERIWLD
jgi:heme exporter protein B